MASKSVENPSLSNLRPTSLRSKNAVSPRINPLETNDLMRNDIVDAAVPSQNLQQDPEILTVLLFL